MENSKSLNFFSKNVDDLKSLNFFFVREIRDDIFEKIYAKDIQEENTKVDVYIESAKVCFWDNSGGDHRLCVNFSDILMA